MTDITDPNRLEMRVTGWCARNLNDWWYRQFLRVYYKWFLHRQKKTIKRQGWGVLPSQVTVDATIEDMVRRRRWY